MDIQPELVLVKLYPSHKRLILREAASGEGISDGTLSNWPRERPRVQSQLYLDAAILFRIFRGTWSDGDLSGIGRIPRHFINVCVSGIYEISRRPSQQRIKANNQDNVSHRHAGRKLNLQYHIAL